MLNIVIADDHEIYRDGLKTLINSHFKKVEIREASSGKELLFLLQKYTVDVVLLDLQMPHIDGIEAAKIIKSQHPEVKIIVLTFYSDPSFTEELLKIGVNAFLVKDAGRQTIIEALETVREQNYYDRRTNEIMHQKLREDFRLEQRRMKLRDNLSPKEIEIIKFICEGYSSKQISDQLAMSTRTVEGYRNKLLDKTNCANSAALVRFAIKNGICEA